MLKILHWQNYCTFVDHEVHVVQNIIPLYGSGGSTFHAVVWC